LGIFSEIRGRLALTSPSHAFPHTVIFTWSRYGKALAAFEVP
jgi:hypothetical protein